ncbi:putative serine/threonine protein kinase, putative,protein kinase [Trypanosoma conorhini]|uniref:Putative serine/threonine protein kinase, putative,protein kinase n=1 Tax=Trypanosoma conorhini TaxID=83891 RepID=A0A3R7L587_9TRYP|nr:putative serine/threonine protein kinase, putative,protein kinase [Trypanosoma conorhini]RNF19962.1 putative serine/threonine protein kinase, putative,protein kinase [Trypanosoma conorhini]
MARQRRPAAVARFLNMISLDERHAATNALLLLGLRAYKQAVAAAPAELPTLRSVVDTLFGGEDGNAARCEPEEPQANNDAELKDACVTGKSPPLDRAKMVLPVYPTPGGVTARLASASAEEKATKSDAEERALESSNGVTASSRPLPKEEMPPARAEELCPMDIHGRCNTWHPHSATLSGGGSSCSCSSSSFGGASTGNKKRLWQYPALCFILNENVESTMRPWFKGNSAGTMGSSALGATIAFAENDKPTNHASLHQSVGESDRDEQSSAAEPMVNVSVNSTVVPSSYCGDHYYPPGFLQQLIRHIEDTRGVRENLLVVASSIPQSMALFTLHASFGNLYISLLVSYHLSFRDDKSRLQGHAQ